MSVVSQQSRRRWAIVAAGVAVLLCLPAATSAAASLISGLGAGSGAAVPSPRALVQRALASASVPYSGLAQSSGTLGLPDLPQLGDVAAQLGGTTRTRVWWSGPQTWRVSVLTSTGEQGIYDQQGRTVLWDYEQARLTQVTGSSPVRLPRADDLLPPEAARRLLGGIGPADSVRALPGRRLIAGVRAEGVRIVPGNPLSTIGQVDLWLDPVHGLPVAIDVVDLAGAVAIRSAFLDLRLSAPDPADVRVPSAPGAVHDTTAQPDLASRIQQFDQTRLPATLAGLTSSTPIVGGTATYGTGLVRFVALPLPGRLASQTITATRTGGGSELTLPGGEALLVSSGLINLVVARATGHRDGYLIAGLVSPALLTSAAGQLLQNPPPERFS